VLNSVRDRFISAIYAISLSPDSYNETLDQLDELLFGHLDLEVDERASIDVADGRKEGETLSPDDPALLTHIENVRNIQINMGRQPSQKSKLHTLMDATPTPAVIFDRKEVVQATNVPVRSESGAPKTLSDLVRDEDVLAKLRDFLAADFGPKLLILPIADDASDGSGASILIRKIEDGWAEKNFSDKPAASQKLYFLTVFELTLDSAQTDLFRETFNLTQAELEIATHLANGRQIQEIAEVRNAQVSTIRTQLKSLKKKTNTRDIPAIVRLLSGFAIGMQISSQLAPQAYEVPPEKIAPLATRHITVRDGRKLTYLEQGNPDGAPVVMLHNMPYGAELPDAAHEAAHRMNLRIICPIRPGYGDSDPLKGLSIDKLLIEIAADTYELLDRLGIAKAAIVGQSMASVHALIFAKTYPNRVSGLFSISWAPIQSQELLQKMPSRQRFIQRLTKHMPQLLPVVIQSTITFLDKGFGWSLLRSLLRESDVDVRYLDQNPGIRDLVVKSLETGLKQGSGAFCQDCLLTVRDYSEEAKTLQHRFHILHGDQDGIVDKSRTLAFADAVPGTTVEMVPGAGHLLKYSHWERVLKAIKNGAKRA